MPPFAPRRHRAQETLTAWTQAQPWRRDYWRAVDAVRQTHARAWPRTVYLPLEEAGAIVAAAWRAHGRSPTPSAIVSEAAALSGFAAWRVTQGVYRYDPTLYDAVCATDLTGDLPTDALTRLPEWGVYIETPGRTVPTTRGDVALPGIYVWLDWVAAEARDPDDWTAETAHAQLMIGHDLGWADLPVSNIPLIGALEQAIRATRDQWQDNYEAGVTATAPTTGYGEAAARVLPPLVALTLYLCSDEPDLGGRRPTRPTPVRTKDGWRLFPAQGLTRWDVGVRLGAALRSAQAAAEASTPASIGARARPRPHIRRAHFHGYWTGPREVDRTDERRLVVRWQHPTLVNVASPDDLPTTIHPVTE